MALRSRWKAFLAFFALLLSAIFGFGLLWALTMASLITIPVGLGLGLGFPPVVYGIGLFLLGALLSWSITTFSAAFGTETRFRANREQEALQVRHKEAQETIAALEGKVQSLELALEKALKRGQG